MLLVDEALLNIFAPVTGPPAALVCCNCKGSLWLARSWSSEGMMLALSLVAPIAWIGWCCARGCSGRDPAGAKLVLLSLLFV